MSPSPFHGIFSSLLVDEKAALSPQKITKTEPKSHDVPPQKLSVAQIALDIFEYENYYVIKAPMAGVKLSDIDIEINDAILTIKGTRKQTDNIPDDQYYLRECFWGPFERSITLPCPIDSRKVKATFNKDNMLKIFVGKEERVKIVRIND